MATDHDELTIVEQGRFATGAVLHAHLGFFPLVLIGLADVGGWAGLKEKLAVVATSRRRRAMARHEQIDAAGHRSPIYASVTVSVRSAHCSTVRA